MKFEDKANVIYSFSARHQPVAELAPGEVIVVETADCYSGQVHQAGQSLEAIDHRKTNPATGPFYVSGTEPGDTLVVEILEIKTAQQGIMVVAPNMGVLGDQVAAPELRLIKLHETSISFGELTLPLQPMLGVIGVAPEAEEAEPTSRPHGGNLDTKEIRPGSKVYLPVFHPGALLALGDVHALMGDGEVSGTAVETSAEVKIRVDVIKGSPGFTQGENRAGAYTASPGDPRGYGGRLPGRRLLFDGAGPLTCRCLYAGRRSRTAADQPGGQSPLDSKIFYPQVFAGLA